MANRRIALLGNPNSGKTSLYNQLARENQKTGNFSGVTVERRSKSISFQNTSIELIDLPGTYSLFSTAPDEQVVYAELIDSANEIDVAVVVVDKTMLRRSMFLLTQLLDLNITCVVAFNMNEAARKAGIEIDLVAFEQYTGIKAVEINARTGSGVDQLQSLIVSAKPSKQKTILNEFVFEALVEKPTDTTQAYSAFLKQTVRDVANGDPAFCLDLHRKEILKRYEYIDQLIQKVGKEPEFETPTKEVFGVDRWVLHNVWGYVLLLSILFVVFQSVYSLAAYPMEWIDGGVSAINEYLQNTLPTGPLTDLFTEGIVSGLGGVVIFIPQIAFLFIVLSFLEESGYMVRVIYLMDSIMTKFGMSGRSIVPLVSASACAIPAIMSTRSIDNWKERIITIMVTPFISCSARLPVYAVLIALAIPDVQWGIFNLKGMVFLGLYLLGVVAAIGSAYLMKIFFKPKERSFLMMELPLYRWPQFGKVVQTTFEKTSAFVLGAGKIILAISILLWVLASFGPNVTEAVELAKKDAIALQLNEEEAQRLESSYKLEASYAGILGKSIEPVIRPLGYDWKIGIALISSFAAREVFVGTLATIYSVGEEDEGTLIEKMRAQKFPGTTESVYSLATSISLLVFYVFAMQCMSTLAIVKRETGSWKWPAIQFTYMLTLSYVSAFLCYQFLK